MKNLSNLQGYSINEQEQENVKGGTFTSLQGLSGLFGSVSGIFGTVSNALSSLPVVGSIIKPYITQIGGIFGSIFKK